MFISRVTISGFKSFATKTSFGFKPGVSAIVGPNGSGKSNVADALRWVFGEQSAKSMRVKKSEDVIFAGTGKKARGSVAEVAVVFDNDDGALKDFGAEVQVSRKLYGSGESEYRIAGKKVRLQDVQELLAQARIGAGSYAIIGQGAIDGLITSSPAERKLLFEEASGIREFELKREQAMRRMRSTAENVATARQVLAELEPRLQHLQRSLEASRRREELSVQVSGLEAAVEVARYQELQNSSDVSNKMIARIVGELEEIEQQEGAIRKRLKELALIHKDDARNRQVAARSLDRLEAEREHLVSEQSLKRAELSYLEERQAEAETLTKELEKVSLTIADHKLGIKELELGLKSVTAEHEALAKERQKSAQSVRSIQAKLVSQRKELSEAAPHEYITHAQSVLSELSRTVGSNDVDIEAVKLLTYKVRRLLTLATQEGQGGIIEVLKTLQSELTTAIKVRELTEERYTNATLRMRGEELKIETAQRKLKDLYAEQERATKALVPFAKMGENASQRANEIEQLQQKLAANKQEIDQARQLLRSQQQDTAEQSELATQLEKNAFHKERLHQDLSVARAELEQLKQRLKSVDARLLKQATASRLKGSSEDLERELISVRAKLEALQELNQNVSEEHAEVERRHKELSQQIGDLERAQEDLETLTSQLDDAITAQFESGFKQISDGFSQRFQQLFGGGSAQLILDKSDDELGVEIEVVPPGKRVRNLRALSGGERSMAGIALLAAIIEAHPSPVLIMDEVDAALDEVNSERFEALLSELSGSSQIIVITHNRRTMAAAKRLYGVTMDAQHVSRMVSVELAQAQEMANSSA